MDKIFINNLKIQTSIGVQPRERDKKQSVLINATLITDCRPGGQSDNLNETVDYSIIKRDICTLVENNSFHLLEKLAEEIARVCLRSPQVRNVIIKVEKPDVYTDADSVGIEINRNRRDYKL